MAKAEFDPEGFDSETAENDESEKDIVVVAVSMELREAETRREVASKVEGVQFNTYSNKEYKKAFGEDPHLSGGKVIGRTVADNWEVMSEYGQQVKDFREASTQKN